MESDGDSCVTAGCVLSLQSLSEFTYELTRILYTTDQTLASEGKYTTKTMVVCDFRFVELKISINSCYLCVKLILSTTILKSNHFD